MSSLYIHPLMVLNLDTTFAFKLKQTLEAAQSALTAMAVVVVAFIVLLAAVPAYGATDYTVGDSQGWTQGVDYSTWTSGKTFNVGDTLLFQYGFLHSLSEVSKSDYDGCSSSNAIQSHNDQSTKITLSAPGSRYFICGTSGHCSGGMKLAVTVSGSSPSTPSGGSSPSTPSSGSPATPTPSTNNAAAGHGFRGGDAILFLGSLMVVGVALLV